VSDIFSQSFDDIFASSPQIGDIPAIASTDFSLPSGFDLSNIFGNVAPVQNMPSTGSTGLTGLFSDASNLAATIFRGQAQATTAKSAAQIAQAQAEQEYMRQAASSSLTPWLFVAIAAAGILVLRSGDSGPPVQSIVSTTRRGR
jgi:hypothetical protein